MLGEFEDVSDGQGTTPVQDLAEQLSQWIGVIEAGTLHVAHQLAAPVPMGSAPVRTPQASGIGLDEQLHQTRAILTRAITASRSTDPSASRTSLQPEQFAVARTAEPDFAPFQQRYAHQQRNMALMIGALRDNVRKALSATSPELGQLAALDAVWEQMLVGREQKLLSALPLRLKRRFEQLRKANMRSGHGLTGLEPVDWLQEFDNELEQVLLAELDVRLEPVTGLIEAFAQEGRRQ